LSPLILIIVTLLCFAGIFILTAFISANRRLYVREAEKQVQQMGKLFFYRRIHNALFPKQNFEGVLFVARSALTLAQFGLTLCIFLWLWHYHLIPAIDPNQSLTMTLTMILVIVLALFFLGDFFPRFLGMRYPRRILHISAPLSTPFLVAALPLCTLFFKAVQLVLKPAAFEHLSAAAAQLPPEILQLVQEASVFPGMQAHDKKIFESVADFRKRIAREVMVPRIDMFSLPADTPIRVAAKRLEEEGYSRTPVYRNNIDDIIGVLMWKDIQKKYLEAVETSDGKILDAPIGTITKAVLYTPETKPISNLLQEFRQKQVHLAIVVDEYGGTEGIVTIEDILEELVGEISDEYDDRESLFKPYPQGGWTVDPRMNILDVEEMLGIKIPQEGDYDTVAGYIFYCAGAIPTKGYVIHRDDFELEILDSNDRAVVKVRIKPLIPPENHPSEQQEENAYDA
jgi:putative hemolysin